MQTSQQKKMMAILRKKGATGLVGKYTITKSRLDKMKGKTLEVRPSLYGNDYLPVQFGTDGDVRHRMDIDGMKRTLEMFGAKKQ